MAQVPIKFKDFNIQMIRLLFPGFGKSTIWSKKNNPTQICIPNNEIKSIKLQEDLFNIKPSLSILIFFTGRLLLLIVFNISDDIGEQN